MSWFNRKPKTVWNTIPVPSPKHQPVHKVLSDLDNEFGGNTLFDNTGCHVGVSISAILIERLVEQGVLLPGPNWK